MKNRRDMYIDYERSYRKRTRRGRKHTGAIILVVFLALALGTAAYLGVKARLTSDGDEEDINSDGIGGAEDAEQNDNETVGRFPTPAISIQPTVAPTAKPTVTPTSAVSDLSGSGAADTRIPVKVRGIYVTAPRAGSGRMEDLIALVDTTELNTMVIDVKDDHGNISYKMDNAMAKEIGAVTNTISDMKTLVDELKAKNIYLIARIVAFKDPLLAEKRQDLAIKNQDGTVYRDNNGEGWVNPYNRQVWDYLVDIAAQAAAVGFDEIQLDYIRFSTGAGISAADFGEEAKTKSKEDIIAEFTEYIYDKIKPLGVFVSADVYGTIISSSIDAGLVGQNYVEMSKYLDYICPMIYPSHFGEGNYGIEYPDLEPYNIIRKVLTASSQDLDQIPEGEHRAVVRPWLQAFTASWIEHYMNYGGQEIREQIEGVYSVDYDEWLLWNAGCSYSADGLEEE
jgi:hypothetical protein